MEIPQVEEFMKELQKSWEQAINAMEEAQKNMKKQFDKKRRNPQGLKVGNNMWLENKKIHSNRSSKKLDNKRYGPFKILKDIGLEVFELKLFYLPASVSRIRSVDDACHNVAGNQSNVRDFPFILW